MTRLPLMDHGFQERIGIYSAAEKIKANMTELNENNIPGTKRLTGEESWTKIKPVKLDPKLARAMKDNLGADSKEHKQTELHEVRQINPSVFIGMDVVKVINLTC